MENILVSACLLGVKCKYSGGDNACPAVIALMERYGLIPVCPEQMGGLPTPRLASEQAGEGVINREGEDVSHQFRRGAEGTLTLARLFGCRRAVLKARSPSCGSGEIYDGSFSGRLISGDGVTARLLRENGITVYSEENFENDLT